MRYPYVRGPLLESWWEVRTRLGDPVAAWAEITGDPERAARYKNARGKGGFVRSTWPEVTELIAAAHVHTVKAYGPDRVVGFSPIPAMSQVSYAAGTRFLSMIGGTILSFYDWYADMPVASPQVFGDQTDVPESGDWWNAAYLIIWGTAGRWNWRPGLSRMTGSARLGRGGVDGPGGGGGPGPDAGLDRLGWIRTRRPGSAMVGTANSAGTSPQPTDRRAGRADRGAGGAARLRVAVRQPDARRLCCLPVA